MVGASQGLEASLCVPNYFKKVTVSDTHFVELKSVNDLL